MCAHKLALALPMIHVRNSFALEGAITKPCHVMLMLS